MQSIGGRKALALAASSLAAVGLLAVAGWMLLGGSDQPTASAVQIIPPAAVDGVGGDTPASADLPNAGAVAASPAGSGAGSGSDGITPARAAPAASAATSSSSPSPPAEIAVYVTGAVAAPGVYTMRQGQRLADALELAGGATGDAALHQINLAAYLADAAHYRIPAVGEAETTDAVSPLSGSTAPAAGGNPSAGPAGAAFDPAAGANPVASAVVTSPTTGGCATPIDINMATADCLQTLPGIGQVRAEAIVAHRQRAGPFAAAESITEVSGIGSGIYGRIAGLITARPR